MSLELTIPKNYAYEKKEKASGEDNNIILHSEQAALQQEMTGFCVCQSNVLVLDTQHMLKTKASAIHAYVASDLAPALPGNQLHSHH